MTFRKLCLGLALVLAGGGTALALAYDGKPAPGADGLAVGPSIEAAMTVAHPTAPVRVRARTMHAELDGDGNHIPGTRGR